MAASDNVINISSSHEEEWESFVEEHCPMVIQTSAKWCGPCKKILPFFKKLSSNDKTVTYCYVDIDKCENLARELEIAEVPTFIYINQDGTEVSRITGGDERELEKWLQTEKKNDLRKLR